MPEASPPPDAAHALTLEQPVRWCDTDALGHVWHGTHLTFAEEARTAWLDRMLSEDGSLWDHVIVHVGIDIRAQLRYADRLAVVTCEGDGHGRSSVRTRERIANPAGELIAELRSVVVAWDAAAGAARPLTDRERERLGAPEHRADAPARPPAARGDAPEEPRS